MLLCQFTDDIVGGRKTYGDRKQEKVANMKQESGFSSVCVALSNHIYRRTQEVCFQCRLLRFTASGLLLTLPFPPSLASLVRKGNLSRLRPPGQQPVLPEGASPPAGSPPGQQGPAPPPRPPRPRPHRWARHLQHPVPDTRLHQLQQCEFCLHRHFH